MSRGSLARVLPFDRTAAPDPEELAAEALGQGDREEALRLLMDAYGRAVFRYCRRLLGDESLAADVHQNTFVQAFQALDGFRRTSSFKTWLYGIARHRCLDCLKAERRRERRISWVGVYPERADPTADLEDAAERRSVAAVLRRCLDRLAPRVRDAILQRFSEGMSYAEMGRASGEKAATLQARVVRSLPALRRCVEGEGVAGEGGGR